MASPAVIDVASLLEPISGDSPAGTDLRKDVSPKSAYSLVRDARKAARASERMNVFESGSSEADEQWRRVMEVAPKIIQIQSKDLEVACWYTEALIRKAGFQGLRDGFTLIRQMIERFWDGLYPLPDEEGIDTRVSPIAGLNGEGAEGVLLAPIRSTHITEKIPPGPYSLWQYKQALDVQRITDGAARAAQATKIGYTVEDVQRAVDASSETFYVNLRDDVSACLAEFKQISQLLDQHCGTQKSPPTSNIINLLTETLSVIGHIAKHKLPVPAMETATDESNATGENAGSGGTSVITGPIKSREDAIRQIIQISQYFRRTEPHSPISYVLEKAVKWGGMSLTDLIKELIPDSGSRTTYSSLTGVNAQEE